uniref:NADH dehydrogenase subunit 6 n=1 Tax=Duolandrevus obsidianus TaxID=2715842 RepID=UPI0030DF3AB4
MFLSTLISIMLIINLTFTSMYHPLAITLLIILQTVLIALMMGPISYSFWFSYILFLIFLGGMLVLFIYITSLASNEMFYIPMKMILPFITFIPIMLIITFLMNYTVMNPLIKQESINTMTLNLSTESYKNLSQLYNYPNMNLTILTIMYLLFTLIVIVKITQIQEGPLRQMY